MTTSVLKVFLCNYDGMVHRIVASTSKVKAAELLDISIARFNRSSSETRSPVYTVRALANPGVVYQTPILGELDLQPVPDPDVCMHCGSRNTYDLDGNEHECYDCGEIYIPGRVGYKG